MKRILLLGIFLIFISCAQNQQRLSIQKRENQFNITFRDQIRFSGIHPVLENALSESRAIQKNKNVIRFSTDGQRIDVPYKVNEQGNIIALYLSPNGVQSTSGQDYVGLFFDAIPEFKQGVAMWRYKPWNSWSKPIRVNDPAELEEWDVQFFYWQYADGLYGAAMPLGGKGFRSTLGQHDGQFGAKAVSYVDQVDSTEIPLVAIGFSSDPYQLFNDLFEQGMTWMGREENLRSKKTFPEPFNYIGWCTWNASEQGNALNERFLSKSMQSFAEKRFPLGWLLIDDGWFDQTNRQMDNFAANAEKFPKGFEPIIKKLKRRYGVRYVGLWHTLNGYWNGINPDSKLGEYYKDELFSWQQPIHPDKPQEGSATGHFIKPDSDSLATFYQNWHANLKKQGFDFVKVDNQLVIEKMAVNNYPIFDFATKMHEAMNASVMHNFNGAIINCMDMTADAWANFGQTAIARSVEDYFEYDENETYNLQKGNAAAHVLQAVYNSLYFGQMVYPDFDMFQSHHPNAEFHAIARAANCGPIYVTDRPSEQNFDILHKLILADGRILNADTPLMPTEDCLFQLQDSKAFKAFSFVGENGLLAVWNCADADHVSGLVSPGDIHGIQGDEFAVYDYFNNKVYFMEKDESLHVKLKRMDRRLFYIVNADHGFAPLGLIEKYNALKTIKSVDIHNNILITSLQEGGKFACFALRSPEQVFINGRQTGFYYQNNIVFMDIPESLKDPQVRIIF